MAYITSREASERWGISTTRVTILAQQGRIPGAQRVGRSWLIPTDAEKPADGRTKHSSAAECDLQDNFSFAMFPYRPDWDDSMAAQLSPQEKILFDAQKNLSACRFSEAVEILRAFQTPCGDNCLELCYLSSLALCYVGLNRPHDFMQCYVRVQKLLTAEFPHKKDVSLLINSLNFYTLPFEAIIKRTSYYYNIDYQCFPLMCVQRGYVVLAKEILEKNSADVPALEMLLRFLENTSATIAVEHMHIYLIGIYTMRQQLAEADKHAKAVMKMIYKSGHFFTIVSYYRYFAPMLSSVLEDYPAEFAQKVLDLTSQYQQNQTLFLSALSENSVFAKLQDADFQYIAAVLNDLPNKAIASTVGISEQSVKRKLSELYMKLGVKSKKELKEYILKNI